MRRKKVMWQGRSSRLCSGLDQQNNGEMRNIHPQNTTDPVIKARHIHENMSDNGAKDPLVDTTEEEPQDEIVLSSNSSLAPAGEAVKQEQDILITKYIQACQAGDIATVRDLIGSSVIELGEDCDINGVSGLHWAAINNRLSVVKYLVEQGAQVDREGGDLNATPLHWACRYGLVYIVDFLTRAGADPLKTDTQGFNALHLAVHSSNVMLVIYVLNFLSVDIDTPDPNGRTALHWAAYQGDSLSVIVLSKANASVRAIDSQGFTPLHWALIRGTRDCLESLLESGSDISATTNEGKNCFAIAKDMNSTTSLTQALYAAGYTSTGEPVYKPFDERKAKLITFFLPYPLLGVIFKLFADTNAVVALLCTTILGVVVRKLLLKHIFPSYNRTSNAFLSSPFLAGLFSSSTFWVFTIWVTTVMPSTIFHRPLLNIVFLCLASSTVYTFQRAMFRDPGIIEPPITTAETKESITALLSEGKYDAKHFCVHTLVRKPLRSKYSYFLKKCVARFDHTCPWVYNDVGLRNHKVFLFFVYSLFLCIITLVCLVGEYFDTLEDDDLQCYILGDDELCAGFTYSPFIFLVTTWSIFQLIWLTFLVFSQTFQITKGLTTFELTQLTRFGSQGQNPYYSSVPQELASDATTEVGGSHNSGSQNKTCLTSFCLITGLNQFVIALKQFFGVRDGSTPMEIPTDYGLKQNMIDFWFASGDDHLDIRNFFKLPVKDEATLGGQVVNYYKLYSLPEKKPTYENTV